MGGFVKRIKNRLLSYRNDRYTKNFILHNRRLFGGHRNSQTSAEILFELNEFHSAHIAYSYLANMLAGKFEARIVAYSPAMIPSIWRSLEWHFSRLLSLREFAVYRSFGATGFIQPHLNRAQVQKTQQLADRILDTIKLKTDVESIQVGEVWLGDLIYDTYLKDFKQPTIQVMDESFRDFLREALALYVFWDDYFSHHDVRAVNVSHCVYINAIPLRIAVSRGIPAYQVNATHAYRLSEQNLFAYNDFFHYPEIFRSLPADVQAEGLAQAKQRIDRRFSGEVGVDMRYSTKSAYGEHKAGRLLRESGRIKVLIATHCFFDSPHSYGNNLFVDFYEWLDFLGKMTLETDYDWYIKTHPDYLPGTKEIIDSFVKKYPRFQLLPADSSHHQIIAEGINVALTTYGTIGFEYAALAVPVINASVNNPHVAYDFNIHPKTIEEYRQLLLNLDNLELLIDKQKVYEYYFMKNFYNTNDWLFQNYEATIRSLGGYRKQFTSKVYKKWLAEWTPERHAKIIGTLQKFVDSGDFHLDRRHGCK